MPLRGSYLSISRQVDELARRAERVVVAAGGCATCRQWPDTAVVEVGDAAEGVPGSSLLARYGARHRDGAPAGWPPELACPDCDREPPLVIRLVYVDRGPTTVHLHGGRPDWEPGDTS